MSMMSKTGLNPEAPSFLPHSITTSTTTYYYYHFNPYYPQQLPHTNLLHHHLYHHQQQQEPYLVYPSAPPKLYHSPPPAADQKVNFNKSVIKGHSHRDGKHYFSRQSSAYANSTNGEKQFVKRKKKKIINSSSSRKLKKDDETVTVKHDGNFTTVMIKNIPIKYTRELLAGFMEEYCILQQDDFVSAFDLLYLPIDFSTGMNKGYAFVNFTDPRAVWKFKQTIDGKAWPLFQSRKHIALVYARFQGKEELLKRFEGMMYPCEDYMPLYFTPPHPLPPHDASKSLSSSLTRTSIGRCM